MDESISLPGVPSHYAAPGALPDVRAGTPRRICARRDFTVNAIAVPLGGARRGTLRHVPEAMEDLAEGRLRVLHDGSFIDDPTRLLRMARYAARLGFEVEESTAKLAREAIAAGALGTASGARIGAELRLALNEPDALSTLVVMHDLGIPTGLHPRLRFDEPVARATLALLPADGRPDLALLASLVLPLVLRADGDRSRETRAFGANPRFGQHAEIVALLDRWTSQRQIATAWWPRLSQPTADRGDA